MYFTEEDYRKIERWLQQRTIKDTQFSEATPLTGSELLSIVQQGYNRKISLKSFIQCIGDYTISDFINLSESDHDYHTLDWVIRQVNPVNRKVGQVITFMNSKTGGWSIYQFKGTTVNEWFNLELWDDILAKVDNHFKGWFLNDCLLNKYILRPNVGDFVFIGPTLEDAVIYACIKYGEWYETKQPALKFADKFDAVNSKDFDEFDAIIEETHADRATKDALGNIIHDTYITREALNNAIREEVLRQLSLRLNT